MALLNTQEYKGLEITDAYVRILNIESDKDNSYANVRIYKDKIFRDSDENNYIYSKTYQLTLSILTGFSMEDAYNDLKANQMPLATDVLE